MTGTQGVRPLSFRTRLTLQWTMAFGVLLAVAGLVIYLGARTYLTRELDRKVRTLARTEAASATDGASGSVARIWNGEPGTTCSADLSA